MKDRPIVPAILLAVAFGLAAAFIPKFLDVAYLLDTTTLYVEIGLLALGMTIVIVGKQIDLSVGSSLVLSSCVAAQTMIAGHSPAIACLLAVAAATAVGLINGSLVAWLGLPSFLVTLATMAMVRGSMQAWLGPKSAPAPAQFYGIDQSYIVGMPWPLFILLVAAVFLWALLHKSVFGRQVFAIGTNERAAKFIGLPVIRTKIAIFALSGFFAGVAGLLMVSRLGVARHDLAKGIELDAIAAAVLGGAAIAGGKGSISGALLSVALLMTLKTAMGVANVKAEYQLTAIGAILMLAVLAQHGFDALAQHRRQNVRQEA